MDDKRSALPDAAGILDTIQQAYLCLDSEFRCTFVNRAAETLIGRGRAELLGKTIWDASPEHRGTEVENHIRRAMRERVVVEFEEYFARQRAWVSVSATPDPAGGVILHLVDITSRKWSEMALAKSQEIAKVGSWELDVVANRLSWTDEVYRIFGLRPQEFGATYQAFLEAVHPEDRAAVNDAYWGSLREGRDTYEIEHRVVRNDTAEVRYVHEKCEHVRDASGQIVRSIGIVQDITGRKRAEVERERLTSAIEQSGEAVMVTGADGIIQYVNPAFERIAGYAKKEAIGKTPRILKSGRQDQEFYRAMWRTISSGETWEGRVVNRRQDGSEYTAEVVISPVCGSQGKIVNYVAVTRDITRELRMQEHLAQAQKMESVGRLAGGVAHDFNNLLTVINGYCQLLIQRVKPDDLFRPAVEAIQGAGERAAELTRQLLAFSRKQILQPRPLDLNRVLEDLSPMLRRLMGANVEVEVSPEAKCGRVLADAHQLEQVVVHLALNARDAMPNGGRLSIRTADAELDQTCADLHPEIKPGRFVLMSVSDNGLGMDEETSRKIFEPFFTTKEMGKGTGLGLPMVQGVVAQSGGCIDVESEPGKGSTFRIYLPLAEPLAAKSVMPPASSALKGRETVLVAAAEPHVCSFTADVLEEYGYRVLKAGEAAEALDRCAAERGRIHLLLTDVVVGEVTGRELANRVRRLQPGIKVLFVSGYTDDAHASDGALDGDMAVIQKPFSPSRLAVKVREILGPEQA